MADEMAHPPLPASLAKEADPVPFLVVQFVSGWALCTSLVYALIYTIYLCAPSPGDSSQQCVKLTDAETAKIDDLWQRMCWYAAPQAAAAALALVLLPCRRRWVWWTRRALACVALAFAIVSHYMYSAGVRVVIAANPGCLSFRIPSTVAVFAFFVGNSLCYLALLLP